MSRMPPLGVMTFYVIYDNPLDYPGQFVLRRHFQDLRNNVGSVEMTPYVAGSLQDARAALPAGLYRIKRHPFDEPKICEIWI